MQLAIDGGNILSITWQILPYALLTFGEVLVSATGLEFAYSQAPLAMKGVISGCRRAYHCQKPNMLGACVAAAYESSNG